MLEIRNLSLKTKKNDREIVSNFNFILNKDDKVAIIGEEGNGKSTLFKAIYDSKLITDYCNVTGEVVCDGIIGYLSQEIEPFWENTLVNDYFLIDNITEGINYERYDIVADVSKLFNRLNINPVILEQNIKNLSGGEKVKIQIIKELLKQPDILLLDEPTNDLDIDTLEWLEDFIINSKVPIMYISHDETLLEKTANVIIHLEQTKRKTESHYTISRLGYLEYVTDRLGRIDKQTVVAKKQRSDYKKQKDRWNQIYQKVEHQQEIITRADPYGAQRLKKKIHTLKSQGKNLEKFSADFEEIPDVEEQINFLFDDICVPAGKRILNLHIPCLTINDRVLSKNIDLEIIGPKHIVIVGKNGVGKSTLLKMIYESLKDRTDINVGYMPQNYFDLIDISSTAVSFLQQDFSKDEETMIRTLLGSMKFTSNEMLYSVSSLSGGQKAKLLLVKLALDKNNVLILDEPTRNLSPLSNPVIRQALTEYKGTIISVSHDRKYIDEVCDEVYELTENGIILK